MPGMGGGGIGGGGMAGSGMGGYGSMGGMGMSAGQPGPAQPAGMRGPTGQTVGAVALPQLAASDAYAVETHYASLDVELPQRGREYLFTTPRGDIEITARAVSEPLVGRLIRLLALAVASVVLIVLLRVLARVLPALHRNRWIVAAVLLVGLMALVLGIFPILGLAALIYGLVQLIRLQIARRRTAVIA